MVRSPLTGRSTVTRIDTIPTAPLIAEWNEAYRIDITAEFRGVAELDLYRCDETGFMFFMPQVVEGSPDLYRSLQKSKAYYSGALAWENFQALRDLRRGMLALEVGCGNGLFVRRGRELGIDIRGVELNPDAVAAARGAGLPVEHRDVASLGDEYHDRFDCVCSFQVLEHLADPGTFIADCLRLIRPRGLLMFAVPNADGFLKHYHEILDLPPHHMSRWSRHAFKNLEKIFDVSLTRCVTEPLSAMHVPQWIEAHKSALQSASRRLGISETTAVGLTRRVLNLGVRRMLAGQSLYARFEKTRTPR
jgi:2-polyprenyl-3-methyl-5-hydroxy-6-metoxy-1,4-benzoquinol methylase